MNLTLACCQGNLVRNHAGIIPASVKDFFEKCSYEVPCRTSVKLHRTYDAVICGGHFRPGVTAVMERIVSLCGQLPDCPFGKVVVYRKVAVVQKSKKLLPELLQVIERFPVVLAPELRVSGQLSFQPAAYPYHDFLRCRTLSLAQPLFRGKPGLGISALIRKQFPDVGGEQFRLRFMSLVGGLYELVLCMRHADLMYRILELCRLQSVSDEYIGIVSVGHDALQFGIAQEISKNITPPGTVFIEEDGCTLCLVDQYPDIAFPVAVVFAHLAPRLVAVHDGILFESGGLQDADQLIQILLAFLQPVVQGVF